MVTGFVAAAWVCAPAWAEDDAALPLAPEAVVHHLPLGPLDPGTGPWVERGVGESGFEVAYTLDPALDAGIRQALARRGAELAHVLLLDPRDGRLLAYVSTDPARLPAGRAYPTASLMKVVTAAAVLQNAPERARRPCGYVGSPWELPLAGLSAAPPGAKLQEFARALAVSNNQCFARFAVRDLGRDALVYEIERVAFLDATAGHPGGRLELPASDMALAQLGSGLGGSFVTPLGAARLAAALATGHAVEPHWVAAVRDAAGTPLLLPPLAAPRRVWSDAVASRLRSLLVEVTEAGTARRGFVRPDGANRLGALHVAGKTGTLSGTDPAGRYQWFIGVAPADAPRVAIAALVVSPDRRGPSASLVAADALELLFCHDGACGVGSADERLARIARLEADARREREAFARALRLERARQRAFETAAAHQVVTLDRDPRPIGVKGFAFPERLRGQPANGEIVLRLRLSEEGRVLGVKVDSSDLPAYEPFVVSQVRRWRFTPPLRNGEPVRATARLPIRIDIEKGS